MKVEMVTSSFLIRSWFFSPLLVIPCNVGVWSFQRSTSILFSHYRQRIYSTRSYRTMTSTSSFPKVATKIETTLDPCVVLMKELIGKHADKWVDKGGIYSLAQGVVYWKPPDTCRQAIQDALLNEEDSVLHMYGPDEGLPELRNALQEKVTIENGLTNHDIMITAGANQAYVNCVLALLDNEQKAIVFRPYYFNHVMALQMSITNDNIIIGETSNDGIPDIDWLEEILQNDPNIHMVTIVNPGNPTGTTLSRDTVQRIVNLCKQYQCWLILDCTYESFVYDDQKNFDGCFNNESHCIYIFSFSKAYALAGYRCGYLVIPKTEDNKLFEQMLKVQDTIPIAPSRIAQVAALGALQAGSEWVQEQVRTLQHSREVILNALRFTEQIMGGNGAMYVMAKLGIDDDIAVANELVEKYGIAIIPGSFCGFPGWIRVCYANLQPNDCIKAAKRLEQGLQDILTRQ